jgi:hypothetical protein
MKRLILISLSVLGLAVYGSAQTTDKAVLTTPLKKNWYVQTGIDISLQKPYTYEFAESFKEGSSWGLDVALGRWFTPEIGLRVRLNWENGIPLFGWNKANWIAPFYEPGRNMKRGGYLVGNGDVQFDIHNIFFGYDPNRRWNMQVFPRAGIAYNFGVKKGSPLIGVGIGNTFKVGKKKNTILYADIVYNAVSSGFTGHESTNTGTGSGHNAFIDVDFGVQFNLGHDNGFHKVSEGYNAEGDVEVCRSFWSNWFIQAGLDMTLQFPYDHDYSEVFSKGRSFGLDAAVGKWFSPEIGVRLRANWENGFPLFRNNKLEWIASGDSGKSNMDQGGYLAGDLDVLLSVHNLFWPYRPERKWNAIVFARAGLATNLAIKSASPLVGFGCGITRRLTSRLSLYGDMAYQMITSEFFEGVAMTGMTVSTGHNAFMDFNVGVQWDLGRSKGRFSLRK